LLVHHRNIGAAVQAGELSGPELLHAVMEMLMEVDEEVKRYTAITSAITSAHQCLSYFSILLLEWQQSVQQ
jgi:hypothetical protein